MGAIFMSVENQAFGVSDLPVDWQNKKNNIDQKRGTKAPMDPVVATTLINQRQQENSSVWFV